MKRLQEVRQRAREKRLELERTPDSGASLQFMDQVDLFLRENDGFLNSKADVSTAILRFLGYPPEEILNLLLALVFEQVEGSQYTYMDPAWIETNYLPPEEPPVEEEPEEAPEVPEQEQPEDQYQYYQCKSGEIFRAVRGRNFALLTNGGWVSCPSLMSYYYDAASDYWEIDYVPQESAPKQQTCPRCGQVLEQDYLFCPACGADRKERYCPACGKQLPKNARFCPYCGKQQP